MRGRIRLCRIRLCRTLLVLGVLVGLPSIWETLSSSWDPTFQAPALRYGPTHTNHHAFREFTLTLGTIAVMFWAMFQPPAGRTRAMWAAMALAGACHYGGWWLPWPLLGLHTPNLVAELDHEAAALSSLAAIGLAWRQFGGPCGAPLRAAPSQAQASADPDARHARRRDDRLTGATSIGRGCCGPIHRGSTEWIAWPPWRALCERSSAAASLRRPPQAVPLPPWSAATFTSWRHASAPRLLKRTTRSHGPTEFSRSCHERCRSIPLEIEAADASAGLMLDAPRGLLRVTAPVPLGTTVLPVVARRHLGRHPDVQVARTTQWGLDTWTGRRSRASRPGGIPNIRAYSRVNCGTLS